MTIERLREAAGGTVPNAIMPLFWQKGGPVEVVREEMERIGDAGIGAVILEARPHPEYLGDGWWRDVDAVLEIAKRRGMKVWFFDDDTFPTGHAAGTVENAPADARRRFVSRRYTDAVGPARGASFIVERRKFWGPEAAQEPGDLLRVVAYRRAEDSEQLLGDPVDLTDRIADGVLHWDVPDGWWRVFFVTAGAGGGSEHHANHIDYLSSASTQLLIDAVYETIHARYADEFGHTIAGFFSDEPGLYNDPDTFDFDSRLGKPVSLPWNDELAAALAERLGTDPALLLPLLWSPAGGHEREVRYTFMDAVTRLYSENFSRRIGDWCRAHGVEYIGHVIEDNGSHARLGPGAGHYFRAMAGQDMAGVDIIGGQVVPGFSRGPFGNMSGAADGEFFHFGLAKLASSAAHVDPLKQGRSMCETIGAYGWYAGLRLFTWLTNHLLVRGVTHVVPHAFSPAPFPDLDCPPHFYANGQNPQYPHQHLLSAYTNRLSHLLQGGTHVAPFAVLYHAEAEWLGDAMPSERPLRLLMEAQLDADIVPADALCGAEAAEASPAAGGAMRLGGETYDALIVPGSAFLPEHVAAHLLRLDDAGVPVVFVDSVPEVLGSDADSLQVRFRALPQRRLAEAASAMTDRAVRLARRAPSVRVLRRDLGDADVVMLVNESTRDTVTSAATLPRAGQAVSFDAFTGRLTAVQTRATRSGTSVDLELAPGDAVLLIAGDPSAWEGLAVAPAAGRGTAWTLSPTWHVATAGAGASFAEWHELSELRPLSDPDLLPRFSGTARYTATFETAESEAMGPHSLDLGDVYELATVRLNGVDLGTRIAPPYRFGVPDGVLAAHNSIEVEVVNTLAKAQPDFFSAFAQQEPTGLLGPVTLAPLRPEEER
ncbi:glycosyl transferase family 2 [Leifsonia sp. AG29]|uniref:glycosyl transferase family 2 n=1 Tax=Leifsonia sp. AG29 TaxID=2598860 RepID=UPI00131CA6A8|nr:glycosyl transferase family 2 [Leifsonia sp. AG29]